jgi:predicted RNA methylase
MFNKNFYPTPRALATKMIAGLDLKGLYILEPSAGKGDLAEAFGYATCKVHLIECEPQLCDMLAAKNRKDWSIVANDFLSFSPSYQYDAIIMNPPFDAGAAHFLHAWNIADGAHIRCLLNAETLRNTYTHEREIIAEIIAQNGGEVEYIQNAFAADAERRTGVEVALVSIFKPAKKRISLNIGNLQGMQKEDIAGAQQQAELATPSYIKNQVSNFQAAIDALRDVVAATHRFNYYCNGCGAQKSSVHSYNHKNPLSEILAKGTQDSFNEAIERMTTNAWGDFFEKPAYRKLITAGVKEKFAAEQKRLGGMAFSEANLNSFIDTLIGTRGQVMGKAIEDSFNFLTSYDKKNIIHKEGWKTNSNYKVNIKCIVPALHTFDKYGVTTNYYAKDCHGGNFDDLERALCFIAGVSYDTIRQQSICATLSSILSFDKRDNAFNAEHDSYFFTIRIYKKGTMHLKFKDEGVWARFNQAAAKGKNWLG